MPTQTPHLPPIWRAMSRAFFYDPPEVVAPRLLGKLLARRTATGWLAGKIVEVEAYLGPHITATPDPAAHSFRGVTERNRVMFGPPGHAYVYFIYGMYYCVNVTCEPEGLAGCILIRALEPVLGLEAMAANRKLPGTAKPNQLASGPGKLCRALDISRREHNGLDLLDPSSSLQLLEDVQPADSQSTDSKLAGPVSVTRRIGIRHAADLPLRFSVANHPCVSPVRLPKPPV